MLQHLATLLVCAAPLCAQEPAAKPKKEFFYFRMWPDWICRFDPETDQIVAKVKTLHGVGHDLEISHDERFVYQVTGQKAWVEVIDLAKMEVVDAHCFDEVGFVIRVDSVRERPGGKRWYVRVDKIEKKPDSFVIQPDGEWLDYDIEEHEVGKRMRDLPRAIRNGARISPDGKDWHVFGRDLIVLDGETLEEKGKIELSKPLYAGMGPLSIRGEDFYDRKNPDAYRFLYTMRDPVAKNRTLFGVMDLDLREYKLTKYVEFGSLPRVGQWLYSADRKIAVATRGGMGMGGGGGGGRGGGQDEYRDPQTTLVTFDLTNGKKLKETQVDTRNGLRLAALSPDASKLYFTGRGDEIWVFDRDHKFQKVITLPGDVDGWMIRAEAP